MAYSDANYTVRREHCTPPTTAGATTEGGKFRSFQKVKLIKAHAAVLTAGTNAGHGYNVFNGTTSIGTIALGTSGTNVTASSGLLNSEVVALGQISVKSLVDATGVAQIVYEYEVQHDAVQS